jgi:hypothetical protein
VFTSSHSDSSFWLRSWRRVRAYWCRRAHRVLHVNTPIGESGCKVRCQRCGHKFIREKHRGYLVS